MTNFIIKRIYKMLMMIMDQSAHNIVNKGVIMKVTATQITKEAAEVAVEATPMPTPIEYYR